jgi:hypothetical protein
VQSGRQACNISEQHTAAIFRVNKPSAILKKQGAAFIEMLVSTYQTTRLHIPKYHNVNIHRLDSTLDLYVSTLKYVLCTTNHTACFTTLGTCLNAIYFVTFELILHLASNFVSVVFRVLHVYV